MTAVATESFSVVRCRSPPTPPPTRRRHPAHPDLPTLSCLHQHNLVVQARARRIGRPRRRAQIVSRQDTGAQREGRHVVWSWRARALRGRRPRRCVLPARLCARALHAAGLSLCAALCASAVAPSAERRACASTPTIAGAHYPPPVRPSVTVTRASPPPADSIHTGPPPPPLTMKSSSMASTASVPPRYHPSDEDRRPSTRRRRLCRVAAAAATHSLPPPRECCSRGCPLSWHCRP